MTPARRAQGAPGWQRQGIRPAGEHSFNFVPPAMTVLQKGDTIVLAGRANSMGDLKP